MSGIDLWTPIEEGRFHLRSMQSGECISAYLRRTEYGSDAKTKRRIRTRIKLAVAERVKANAARRAKR